jgi:hypothetical protein
LKDEVQLSARVKLGQEKGSLSKTFSQGHGECLNPEKRATTESMA